MSKVFLHIEETCTQNWDAMTSTDKGKYCNSCNKEVIDFTNFSNNQIVQYFNTSTSEKICGRFKDTQLNNWLYESKLKTTNPALYKYLLSIILLAASNNLQAQEIKKPDSLKIEQVLNKDLFLQKNTFDSVKTKINDLIIDKPIVNKNEQVKIRMGGFRKISSDQTPLLIVNNKIVNTCEINNLKPENITSINIIKGGAAATLYGSDGVNGAIIIKTNSFKNRKHKK